MRTINTCREEIYHPLILAMEALYESPQGEEVKIIMDKMEDFSQFRKYLSDKNIGFREIYDGKVMTIEFRK